LFFMLQHARTLSVPHSFGQSVSMHDYYIKNCHAGILSHPSSLYVYPMISRAETSKLGRA
jgi:hypothetical protein